MIEFDWLIHYACNYRCPYCFFEGMWDDVGKRNAYLANEKWVGSWKRIYETYGEFRLTITGGEPFLYPGYVELLGKLSQFANLSFDTNLSCTKETITRFMETIDARRVFLGLSFHPDCAELTEFVEKALLLKRNGFDCRVHFVTYPPNLRLLKEVKDIFTGEGLRFTPIPFRGMYQGKRYPDSFTAQQKETIYGVAGEIERKDGEWSSRQVVQVKSKGKQCYAGQRYARVDSNGDVYLCGNDYAKSEIKATLGNIHDAGFALNEAPVLCRQETCPCEFRWLVKHED